MSVGRPKVPHCATCENCMMRRGSGGWLRFCSAGTAGPPIPIPDRERRHTSPDWCPERYGSVLRLEYERVPNELWRYGNGESP